MKQGFSAHDEPDLGEVWQWYQFQSELIAEARQAVLLNLDPAAAGPLSAAVAQRFVGYTREDVQEFFNDQRVRLELVAMLEILTTVEAVLRIDVRARVEARRKDPASRRFRDLYKDKGERLSLDEDILTVMKEEGVSAGAIAAFRGALKLRHWLAHGRHWHPKLGRGYAPTDVFDIAIALVGSIPAS